MKNKLWSAPYLLFVFVLTLACSGFGGRALWVDEMLCAFTQRMSILQILSHEHLRRYDGLPPLGYLLLRPFQLIFGLETGAHIFTALCTVVIAGAVLHTLCHIIGKRPHPVVSIAVVTNPFLIWHGSEFRFYSLLAAFGSLIMCQLIVDGVPEKLKSNLCLGLLGVLFINSIYSGIFIWSFLAAMILLYVWIADSFKKALRLVPVFAIPILISLPLYIVAMRAQQHLGTKNGITKDALMNLFPNVTNYLVKVFPMLTGCWWLGALIFAFGLFYLISKRQLRYEAFILCSLIAGIIPFLCFSYLRQYLMPATRYWLYAVSPVLLLVALGIHTILSVPTRKWDPAYLGRIVIAFLFIGHIVALSAIVCLDGRFPPYKKIQAYIKSLPPDRTIVTINYYDNRFLGGYYPIPNNGTRISPAAWEEGEAARLRGMKKILNLTPDALIYINGDEFYNEYNKTGCSTTNGFTHHPSITLKLAHKLHLFPEPWQKPYSISLHHMARESLSENADARKLPVTLPVSGFKAVSFRNSQGELFFGLMTPSEIRFDVYVPKTASIQSRALELSCVSYRSSTLHVSVDGKTDSAHRQLNLTHASGLYIPQKQQFKGLPNSEYLVLDGMNFVLAMRPQSLRIPLGTLDAGWHTISIGSVQNSPWIVLSHTCSLQ